MYTIDSAYGVARAEGSIWATADVGTLTPAQAFSLYRSLFLTLSSTYLAQPLVLDLFSMQSTLVGNPATLTDIFTGWGNDSLVDSGPLQLYNAVRAIYTDIFRAGYQINTALPGSDYTSAGLNSDKTELQITRPGTSMQTVQQRCLFTVNGYFYPSETDGRVLYLPNAGKNWYNSRQNQCGLLSFEQIATLQTYPITAAQVRPSAPGNALSTRAYIDLPNVDLTNKSVLLVLGGYLHFLGEGVFWPVSNNTFCIHTEILPLLERYYESRGNVDYSALGLTVFSDTSKIDKTEFFSDAVLTKYFSHEQSFFVVIDTPRITRSQLHLKSLPSSDMFLSYREPKELLLLGTGRVGEYWKVEEDGQWSVNVGNGAQYNRVFSSSPAQDMNPSASSNNIPYKTYFKSHAYLVDIIADIPVPVAPPI